MSAFLKNCPACGTEIDAAAAACPHCGASQARPAPGAPVFDYPPTIITAPIIVSAGWNLLTAGTWAVALPCFGLLIAIPYCVLAYFEVTTFLRAPAMPPEQLYRRCGPLGICQIILGLSNLVPVICGILLLAYRDRLRQYRSPGAV